MEIILVRHAMSIANKEKKLQGQFDSHLSDEGKRQAVELGKKLQKKYDRIYCSTLTRAKQTLEIAMKTNGMKLDDVIYEDDLREMDLGILEKIKIEEFSSDQKKIWSKIFVELDSNDHKGETSNQFMKRVNSIFTKITEDVIKNNLQSILVMTHGGVIRAICQLLNIESNIISNCEMFILINNKGKWKMKN